MPEVTLREAKAADFSFLVAMTVEAANWDGTRGTTAESLRRDPAAWHYLDGWQRPTDFGVVAVEGDRPIGAAWARFLDEDDAGYGYVSDVIPELTLAVTEDARHRGIGGRLLDGLVGSAQAQGLPGLSLSVEDGNDRARALYERAGFVTVGRSGNSDTMLLKLQG